MLLLILLTSSLVSVSVASEHSSQHFDTYDLYSVRKERDRAWNTAKKSGTTGSRLSVGSNSHLNSAGSGSIGRNGVNSGKQSGIGKSERYQDTFDRQERSERHAPEQLAGIEGRARRKADEDLKKSGVRGSSIGSKHDQQCCECLPSMDELPGHSGVVGEMKGLAASMLHGPPMMAPPQAPSGLPTMETMLQDALVVRMFLRSWGRLPPLGADATSERALLGNQASKFYNNPAFLHRAWEGWLDTLHRLGATNLLKELPEFRVIKAPRRAEDLDVLATIDSLWQDLRDQGGLSQEDVDETTSMGLSNQDAQRLEAVSTACKGAVPDEEDETWCMDALPFKGRIQERYDRCALVGNSQRLLLGEAGLAIDSHQLVMRINTAHTFNIKQYTGARTDFRILSKAAVRQYLEDFDSELPLESNVTLLALAADYTDFFQLVHSVRGRSSAAATKRLKPVYADRVKEMLQALKGKLETFLGVQYIGPVEPSTGFMGLAVLLQLCSKVDVYGMQLGETLARWDPHNAFRASSSSYRYYEENGHLYNHPRINELHHSWELEHDVLQILEGAGHIRHHVAPVRNLLTEEEVLQKGVDRVNEANCIRKPGQMWSPFRHMCITE
mmetsp:Transcript_6277/g.8491  ORF Transcript_6277/g.8491 Transcript_6277/m.8491 type:complete len:613 (+) Transcript_6277:45-1883(+)|eukprot:CAMPEP_0196589504 /NCGR_PEP_ID=MMETSP1081-20130531/63726_1 /TAXON_ID=36882 /ORGANISM="Pyramimonas amylifera, Strain CCMP720" /LENGTH=612 /DNA_ID=CAMNT_0041912327 /DNA_START=210 /DNA_END=2048 /DNA_ORIENTATION=-